MPTDYIFTHTPALVARMHSHNGKYASTQWNTIVKGQLKKLSRSTACYNGRVGHMMKFYNHGHLAESSEYSFNFSRLDTYSIACSIKLNSAKV